MKEKNIDHLTGIIRKFNDSKVLVVGDVILDQFIWGDVSRISPEAPVPVVHVERESFMPGGAANVANNISALNGQPHLVGVIGKDIWADILRRDLEKNAVKIGGLITDSKRQTSLKTRIVARHQQVVRVDKEHIKEISKKISKKIIQYVRKNADTINAIIIEDYGKGVIIPALIKEIVKITRQRKIIVSVDPKEDHFSYYRNTSCITPNLNEASQASGIKIVDKKSLLLAGRKLLKKLNCEAVLITRGEHGMCLFEKKGKVWHIPTVAREVFDVSGAGDTVIGAFTLALASGASFLEAALISNYAAGVVVEKLGVAFCSQAELLNRINGN